MSFNPQNLGRRLREARENCSLSQQVAADALRIPRTAITQLEAGHRAVSTLELAQLADLYKRAVVDFFHEEPLEDDLLVALHRLAPGLDARTDIKEQVQHCLNICREGCSLEQLSVGLHAAGLRPIRCQPHTRLVKLCGKVNLSRSRNASGWAWGIRLSRI